MPKKECRYNPKHKFDNEIAQLEHEHKCPDKKKRTDLIECPYTNRHIVSIKQYENHIKKCNFKQKSCKLLEEEIRIGNVKKNDEKIILKTLLNNIGNDEINSGVIKGNNKKKKHKKDKDKIKLFVFEGKSVDDDDDFDEDDFIFKSCYI